MALQGSGAISLSQIRNEISCNGTYSLRSLSAQAGKGTSDSMSEFYGYSHTISLSVLIVAGGGGGGQHMGGGGGGGGARVDGYTMTKGGGGIGVTVGGGGGARASGCGTYYQNYVQGGNGGNSYFGGNVTYGGGGGGSWDSDGAYGGSGGGQGYAGGHVPGAGIGDQGNSGGAASGQGGGAGGGRGGAGEASSDTGGNGGRGFDFSVNGFTQYNWQSSGGSGGTNWNNAPPPRSVLDGSHGYFGGYGAGGGGFCSSFPGNIDAIANRGQGGGGEGDCPCNRGSYGGSGIVQVRYAGGTQASGGNYTYTSGGYTIHVFQSSGTFTPSC